MVSKAKAIGHTLETTIRVDAKHREHKERQFEINAKYEFKFSVVLDEVERQTKLEKSVPATRG